MNEINQQKDNNFENHWKKANQIAALYSYDQVKNKFGESAAREERALVAIFIHIILSQTDKVKWLIDEDMKTLEPRDDIEIKKLDLLKKIKRSNIKIRKNRYKYK